MLLPKGAFDSMLAERCHGSQARRLQQDPAFSAEVLEIRKLDKGPALIPVFEFGTGKLSWEPPEDSKISLVDYVKTSVYSTSTLEKIFLNLFQLALGDIDDHAEYIVEFAVVCVLDQIPHVLGSKAADTLAQAKAHRRYPHVEPAGEHVPVAGQPLAALGDQGCFRTKGTGRTGEPHTGCSDRGPISRCL